MRRAARLPGRIAMVAATVAIATVAAACTSPGVAPAQPAPDDPTEVVVGVVGAFTSFNPATSHAATAANLAVADLTQETFAYLDDQLEVAGNGGFGEVERISTDPLTVRYTLFDGRSWSDGTPVTLDDLLFGWAVHSGWFDDAAYDADGSIVSGTRYFDVAAPTEGLRQTARPVLDRADGALTLTYDEPFADWNREWLVDRPVHLVAELAGVSVARLMAAIRSAPRGDPLRPVEPDPVLLEAADAWNTGFDVELDREAHADAAVSNGPYTAETWSRDEVVLARSPAYVGDHEGGFDRVIVRAYPDVDARLAALTAGEVDVANIGETSAAQLRRLGAAGVTVHTGARPQTLALVFAREHIEPRVRDALVAAIDRERLVEESVAAVHPDAEPAQSFLSSSIRGEEFDRLVSASSPPGVRARPDAAEQLLDGRTPIVRIRYEPTDVLAAELFAEIARMVAPVGLHVRPAGDGEPADAMLTTLDVSQTLYRAAVATVIDGAGGLAARDALRELRARTDPEEVAVSAGEIDAALFAHGYGLPLVERPGAVAVSARVAGVPFSAAMTAAPRSFWNWAPNDAD